MQGTKPTLAVRTISSPPRHQDRSAVCHDNHHKPLQPSSPGNKTTIKETLEKETKQETKRPAQKAIREIEVSSFPCKSILTFLLPTCLSGGFSVLGTDVV